MKDIFHWIGGVPRRLVIDNATGAGRRIGEVVRLTELFQLFKAHYGFVVTFCNPRSGNEKGNVKNIMPKGIPNKRYTPEFKKLVIETMMAEKLSYRETARRFDVSSDTRIKDWERIYLMEGPEGFTVERRGRGSKGRPKQLPKAVEEDLLAEVQRLRAENEYLKNLQALVLERERRQGKKPR